MREIHIEDRPTTFKQVVGQGGACQQLVSMAKGEGIPHCLLFTGPSGCGKTTLARIVRRKLGCGNADFAEINAAQTRGIEMVRDIQARVGLAPIDGPARVWLIDECHQLTADAQGAFLKLLEEPPDHVYFMLATTNPQKLRPTIRTRCAEIKVRALTEAETKTLVCRAAKDRDVELEDEVIATLADMSEGSARKALVLLQQIIGIKEPKDQIEVLRRADAKVAAYDLCRALIARKPWRVLADILRRCEEDPEGIRRLMLAFFTTAAIGKVDPKTGKVRQPGDAARAVAVMEEFQDNYFDSGRAGLVISCYRAANG